MDRGSNRIGVQDSQLACKNELACKAFQRGFVRQCINLHRRMNSPATHSQVAVSDSPPNPLKWRGCEPAGAMSSVPGSSAQDAWALTQPLSRCNDARRGGISLTTSNIKLTYPPNLADCRSMQVSISLLSSGRNATLNVTPPSPQARTVTSAQGPKPASPHFLKAVWRSYRCCCLCLFRLSLRRQSNHR